MAYSFNPTLPPWTTSYPPGYAPTLADFQSIAADIRTAGGARDGARYGQPNNAFITLVPGDLPGNQYTITAISSAGASNYNVTVSGSPNFTAGQRLSIAGVTPSGFNISDTAVISFSGSTCVVAIPGTPGSYSSGGTTTIDSTSVANGQLCVNSAGNLSVYQGGYWQTFGMATNITSSTQYNGVVIGNGAHTIIQLIGFGTGNDSGGLALSSGGVAEVSILTGSGSYSQFNNGPFGIGSRTPFYLLDMQGGTNPDSTGQPSGTWMARIYNAVDSSGMNGVFIKNNWAAATSTLLEVGTDILSGAYISRLHLDGAGNLGISQAAPTSLLHLGSSGNLLPVYANNAAAVAGGLTAGACYRTGANPDPICVVH